MSVVRRRVEYINDLAPRFRPYEGAVVLFFEAAVWKRPMISGLCALVLLTAAYGVFKLFDAGGYLPCILAFVALYYLGLFFFNVLRQTASASTTSSAQEPPSPSFTEAIENVSTCFARWDDALGVLEQQRRLQPGLFTVQAIVALAILGGVGLLLPGRVLAWISVLVVLATPGALYNGVPQSAAEQLGPLFASASTTIQEWAARVSAQSQKSDVCQQPPPLPERPATHGRAVSIP